MSRFGWWIVAVCVASVAAWWATGALPWPARALTVLLLVPLPALGVAQAVLMDDGIEALPRMPVYLTSAMSLWILGAVTLVAAGFSDFTLERLGLVVPAADELIVWGVGGTIAAVLIAVASRIAGFRESPAVGWLLPTTTAEKLGFIVLSCSAGVGEELVFRSFLIPAVTDATGSVVAAVALSSMAFGLVHAYQRIGGGFRAALLGAVLALPLLATGSVIPSMIAHAGYDILIGLWLGRWLVPR